MKRLFVAVLPALVLALAGCSGNSAGSSPVSPPSSEPPVAADPAAASPSPSSSPAASECLSGRYRLIRIVGVGERGTNGTGEGGDVTVTFNDGSYLLHGAGQEPIRLTLAGQTVGLLVDGTISGEFQPQGDRARLTVRESSGSATFTVSMLKKSLPIADVGNVIAREGEAGLGCANNALSVTLHDVRLELAKV